MNIASIQWFQRCAYAWLIGYALALLLLGDAAWSNAPIEVFGSGNALNGVVPVLLGAIGPMEGAVACLALMTGSIALIRRHRTWPALIMWMVFKVVNLRLWLASNGGVQLMENMLLWAAFINVRNTAIATTVFWLARLQLLVAYAAAAAHKFTGTSWLDGTAMLRVAHDPLFHLGWLQGAPILCAILGYLTLAWMTAFPFAVWLTWPRRIVLSIGVLFHLATAVFMGIPQMGLAFLACYPLWLKEDEIVALRVRFRLRR
jgi:hypothetical protein